MACSADSWSGQLLAHGRSCSARARCMPSDPGPRRRRDGLFVVTSRIPRLVPLTVSKTPYIQIETRPSTSPAPSHRVRGSLSLPRHVAGCSLAALHPPRDSLSLPPPTRLLPLAALPPEPTAHRHGHAHARRLPPRPPRPTPLRRDLVHAAERDGTSSHPSPRAIARHRRAVRRVARRPGQCTVRARRRPARRCPGPAGPFD